MSTQGYVEVEGGRVWYEVFGEASHPTKVPVILLHGGPGGASLGFQPFEALAGDRLIVRYDQLGCGNSDRPVDDTLWNIERFVRELAAVRTALGWEKVHILGHSWGTMLLADYLLTQPSGIASAVFSSPCLSAPRWYQDALRLREQLPDDVRTALDECEANSTTDSERYKEAEKVYMRTFVSRLPLGDEERKRRDAAFSKPVYEYMWGPSEFYPTGNLRDYDQTGRLHEINVPSLFTCGRFDEATPESTEYYQSLVPNSSFHVFEHSAHSALREETQEYLRVMADFFARHDK